MLFHVQRHHLSTAIAMQTSALEQAPWEDHLCPDATHFLVADASVYALHGRCVLSHLQELKRSVHVVLVEAGENAKRADVFLRVATEISVHGADAQSTVISLGGASTCNLAGFVASCLFRGIGLVHVPTTLLAQLDGAIDFKQAINVDGVKNMLGSFYAPSLVVVDPRFLSTLSPRHLNNGFAEGLKHALIQDAALYRFFTEHAGDRSVEFLQSTVARTVELKVRLLESDDYDNAEMLLQYGHAIGHALESITNNELLHGEAISIGMCVSAALALELGLCDANTLADHRSLFELYRLPTTIPGTCSVDKLLRLVGRDKYRSAGLQRMALASRIGMAADRAGDYGFAVDERRLRRACEVNMGIARPMEAAS